MTKRKYVAVLYQINLLLRSVCEYLNIYNRERCGREKNKMKTEIELQLSMSSEALRKCRYVNNFNKKLSRLENNDDEVFGRY